MTINRNQTYFTVVTGIKRAEQISALLEKEGRLQTVIRYDNWNIGRIQYYIFYYTYR